MIDFELYRIFVEVAKEGNITKASEKLNVSQSNIAHYIRGDIMPALDTFANLCDILDVDPAYILCLED